MPILVPKKKPAQMPQMPQPVGDQAAEKPLETETSSRPKSGAMDKPGATLGRRQPKGDLAERPGQKPSATRRRALRLTQSADGLIRRATKLSGLTTGQLAYEYARRYLENVRYRRQPRSMLVALHVRNEHRERKDKQGELRLTLRADQLLVNVMRLANVSAGELALAGARIVLDDHARHREYGRARDGGRRARR